VRDSYRKHVKAGIDNYVKLSQRLPCSFPEKHNPDSAEQNFQVHEKRHVFDVIQIVLQLYSGIFQ